MKRILMGRSKPRVFILDIGGNMVRRADWNISNNLKAVGVAVLSNNCNFVISSTENSSEVIWGAKGTTIGSITTTIDPFIAKQDYAGCSNTDKIITQLGSGNSPAAEYCRNLTFGHGKSGYLGSLGEWQKAFNNREEINACMSLIGGVLIVSNRYYWTSTQYSSDHAWYMDWSTARVNGYSKSGLIRVRAFSVL